MAVSDYELIAAPPGERARELWIQHAAGFVFIEDVLKAALTELPPTISPSERAIAETTARNVLYCLMQVIDGVTGGLANDKERIDVNVSVTYSRVTEDGGSEPIYSLDLRDGDGVCMGVHGWFEGDFGDSPVARRRA